MRRLEVGGKGVDWRRKTKEQEKRKNNFRNKDEDEEREREGTRKIACSEYVTRERERRIM